MAGYGGAAAHDAEEDEEDEEASSHGFASAQPREPERQGRERSGSFKSESSDKSVVPEPEAGGDRKIPDSWRRSLPMVVNVLPSQGATKIAQDRAAVMDQIRGDLFNIHKEAQRPGTDNTPRGEVRPSVAARNIRSSVHIGGVDRPIRLDVHGSDAEHLRNLARDTMLAAHSERNPQLSGKEKLSRLERDIHRLHMQRLNYSFEVEGWEDQSWSRPQKAARPSVPQQQDRLYNVLPSSRRRELHRIERQVAWTPAPEEAPDAGEGAPDPGEAAPRFPGAASPRTSTRGSTMQPSRPSPRMSQAPKVANARLGDRGTRPSTMATPRASVVRSGTAATAASGRRTAVCFAA